MSGPLQTGFFLTREAFPLEMALGDPDADPPSHQEGVHTRGLGVGPAKKYVIYILTLSMTMLLRARSKNE